MLDPLFEIKKEKDQIDYGKFVIEPLAAGFGHTLGTALRRILLTSLPGAAVTKVKIAGVRHRFTTLNGMKEDVLEFILNLKDLRITLVGDKPASLKLDVIGPGAIKAKQIRMPAQVKIINPELVLANLADRKSKLKAEITIEKGVGYSPFEERKVLREIGVIPVDAIFSPVVRVNFQVAATRVGRMTNFDKLVFEIWTDGTIKPSVALVKAAETLDKYIQQIIKPQKPKVKKGLGEDKVLSPTLRLSVEELNLPMRIANTLVRSDYLTVGDLLKGGRKKIAKVKNLGQKSLKIIEAALAERKIDLPD